MLHAADRRRRSALGRRCPRLAAGRRGQDRGQFRRRHLPELVADIAAKFGSQCVVASVDARKTGTGWEIFTHGGRKATGIDAVEHAIRLAELGAGELLVTSMDGDGTQGGYDLLLTRRIADAVAVPVVASGGVGTLEHLVEGVTKGHASAVLAASIFHFGTYTIAQAHAALRAAGLPARG